MDRETINRFNAKWVADPETGCWRWIGAHLPAGYGILKKKGERTYHYAHRLSYEMHTGLPSKGKHVLHKCDHPWCVNPDHLFIGTSHDNHMDQKQKNRHLAGQKNGNAKISEQDVREIKALASVGMAQHKIADRYGVCQMQVSRIVRGTRWSHMTERID